MPIPNKRPTETTDEFLARCMGNSTMVAEYPDTAQRYAVCVSKSREVNLKK